MGTRPCGTATSQMLIGRPCSTSYENNGKSQVSLLAMKAGCSALPVVLTWNLLIRHVSSPKVHSRNVCSPPLKQDGQAVQHYQCRWMQRVDYKNSSSFPSSTWVALQTGRFFPSQQDQRSNFTTTSLALAPEVAG